MIDEKHLTEVIDKIYSIDCKKQDCEKCKNGLEWCPKEYADEVQEGLLKISNNISICEKISNKLK